MPTTPRVWVSKIKFSDGNELEIEKDGITVLVGPNNAGKSVSLSEIDHLLLSRSYPSKVVKEVSVGQEGDEEDLVAFLKSVSREQLEGANPLPTYFGLGYNIYESNARSWWVNPQNGLNDLKRAFVNPLTTEARIAAANPPQSITLTTQPPAHPIHILQRDTSQEKRFSEYFKQAFGTDLILHRHAGNIVPLYVGGRPELANGEEQSSISYLKKIEQLPLLHEQGDGMRSFVGVLLNTFVSHYPILLIDEPEAFLHPPQARLLGKMLANDLPAGRQLILATHNEDFLKGLLDAEAANLKIIRIQRDGNINRVCELNNDDIKNVWSDPILRYSNILSGIFHSRVILCESDSDCRFYSAVSDAVLGSNQSVNPDILFVHSGGKHRMPVVIDALIRLNVPMSVVADFDVIREENVLKKIFGCLGGDWDSEIYKDWKLVRDSIDSRKPEIETGELKSKIEEILSNVKNKNFPETEAENIKKLLRKSSAWSYAKEQGRSFIPAGDPVNAWNRLLAKLNESGLFVVEIGELESFDRSIGNHGPKWLNNVLRKNLLTDTALEDARKFVKKIIGIS